jgi:hypothetical protein
MPVSEEPRVAVYPPQQPPAHEAPSRPWSLELAGLGTWGEGRSSPDVGGTVGVQRRFRSILLRAAVSLTGGALPEAAAGTLTFGASAGLGYFVPIGNFNLAIRLDLAAVYLAVSRDDGNRNRWMLGVKPRLEGAYTISGPFAGFAAVGADAVVSGTRVYVDGRQTAELGPVSGALEIGFRVSF